MGRVRDRGRAAILIMKMTITMNALATPGMARTRETIILLRLSMRLKRRKTRKARSILRLESGLFGSSTFIMKMAPTRTTRKSKAFHADDQNLRYGPPHDHMFSKSSKKKMVVKARSKASHTSP